MRTARTDRGRARAVVALLVILPLAIGGGLVIWLHPHVRIERQVTLVRENHPIHDAILEGKSAEEIGRLVDRDPSQLKTDRCGGALPLHDAIDHKRVDLIELFLKRGADPNARIEGDWVGSGMTPLEIAVVLKSVDATRALLAGGADPNVKGTRGEALDDIAIANNTPEILELLRKARDRAR